MQRQLLETRRQVMSAVVCDYPGGRECAAAFLGLPLKKLDNHVYESAGSRPLDDEQLHRLEQQAGTRHLPDYICSLYGGVFVPVADPAKLDSVELYAISMATAVKRGNVDRIIAAALADGHIDEKELSEILAAHRQHIAARYTEITAVISLYHQEDAQ